MLLNPERPNPACQRCPTVANRIGNNAVLEYRLTETLPFLSAMLLDLARLCRDRAARPGPHTCGKPRLLDVGRRILARDRFAPDSPLEGTRFEPSVPRDATNISKAASWRLFLIPRDGKVGAIE